VHCRERIRGHSAPGAAEAAGAVVVMGLQRGRVAVVLRGATVVMLVGGCGGGGCGGKVRMGVRVRVVYAASHVVRVLLELDECRLGRGYRRDGAATTAARILLSATGRRAVIAVVGASAAARAQRGRVHGISSGHRRRRAGGPLLLLLVTSTAPSERASDLPVIQRDGRRVQRTGGKIDGVSAKPCDVHGAKTEKHSRATPCVCVYVFLAEYATRKETRE